MQLNLESKASKGRGKVSNGAPGSDYRRQKGLVTVLARVIRTVRRVRETRDNSLEDKKQDTAAAVYTH